jgi:hypothetical protein
MIEGRCPADGADLVCLIASGDGGDYYEHLYCPICSTAILVVSSRIKPPLRIRWRYRAGDLFLLDPEDARAHPHLDPLRREIAQFLKVGLPFVATCHVDGKRVPVVAEAERLKLVWCKSCSKGTAYVARPRYGWSGAGVFRFDASASRHVLADYFGPCDLESLVESAVAELKPATS